MLAYLVFLALAIVSAAANASGYIGFDIFAFSIFVLALAALIYKDRKKVKLEGVMFIRRTQRGRDFIDRTAQRHRGFWGKWATLGLIIGIPVMALGSVYLFSQAATIVQGGAEGGVRLLLPGPVSQPVNAPGIFVVPWWIWIIGIAAVIIPHEFMHGIVCRLDKIKIKSVGWILLIVIPGAFVEPDEKQLQRAKRSTRMKVYAAGSFANLVVAFAIILIFVVSFAALFQPAGLFVQTVDGGPANQSGLFGSITAIDGRPIRSMEDLSMALQQHKPGDSVNVRAAPNNILIPTFDSLIPRPVAATDLKGEKEYLVTLAEHPEEKGKAYMGVAPQMKAYKFGGDIFAYQSVSIILLWIFVFSFGIGLVNLLPIKPLDGGLLFEEIVGHFTPRTKGIVKGVSIVMIFLILFNLIGPIFL